MDVQDAKRRFIIQFCGDDRRGRLTVGVNPDRSSLSIEVKGKEETDIEGLPDEFLGFKVNKTFIRYGLH